MSDKSTERVIVSQKMAIRSTAHEPVLIVGKSTESILTGAVVATIEGSSVTIGYSQEFHAEVIKH